MNIKHTPGPWHVDTLDGTVYAASHRTVPQNDADARLIAAAPELLAALQELVAKCDERGFHPTALLDARAAIAKAT